MSGILALIALVFVVLTVAAHLDLLTWAVLLLAVAVVLGEPMVSRHWRQP